MQLLVLVHIILPHFGYCPQFMVLWRILSMNYHYAHEQSGMLADMVAAHACRFSKLFT
eukprot:UN09837